MKCLNFIVILMIITLTVVGLVLSCEDKSSINEKDVVEIDDGNWKSGEVGGINGVYCKMGVEKGGFVYEFTQKFDLGLLKVYRVTDCSQLLTGERIFSLELDYIFEVETNKTDNNLWLRFKPFMTKIDTLGINEEELDRDLIKLGQVIKLNINDSCIGDYKLFTGDLSSTVWENIQILGMAKENSINLFVDIEPLLFTEEELDEFKGDYFDRVTKGFFKGELSSSIGVSGIWEIIERSRTGIPMKVNTDYTVGGIETSFFSIHSYMDITYKIGLAMHLKSGISKSYLYKDSANNSFDKKYIYDRGNWNIWVSSESTLYSLKNYD